MPFVKHPMHPINTRTAWRGWLRPTAGAVVAAQIALALQPLSALAQAPGAAPVSAAAQAQLQRVAQWQQRIEAAKIEQARAAQPPGAVATERTSRNLTRVHELLKGIKARGERPGGINKAQSPGSAQAAKAAANPDHADQADQAQISELLTAIDADTDAVLQNLVHLLPVQVIYRTRYWVTVLPAG